MTMILAGVAAIALLLLWVVVLFSRLRALDERVARLEGQREGSPYRAAPPRPLHDAPVGGEGNDEELVEALRAGNKIQAIKRYRQLTGAGLKEAKEAVEAIEARGV